MSKNKYQQKGVRIEPIKKALNLIGKMWGKLRKLHTKTGATSNPIKMLSVLHFWRWVENAIKSQLRYAHDTMVNDCSLIQRNQNRKIENTCNSLEHTASFYSSYCPK